MLPSVPVLPPQPPMAPQQPVQMLPSVPTLPPQPPLREHSPLLAQQRQQQQQQKQAIAPQQPAHEVPPSPASFTAPPDRVVPPAGELPDEDLDATRVSTRRPAKAPWRLLLPNGSTVSVSSPVLIGRNPVPHDSWPNAQLLLVVDKTKSVSKTHVAVETDDEGLWVTDLKSTNGVVVTYSDGREVEAHGGERLNVDAGCGIELGRFIMLVEKA